MPKLVLAEFRNIIHAAWRQRVRLALELMLLSGAGALCGVAFTRVPAVHQALHAAGLGRHVSVGLLETRFVVTGAPETYVLVYTSPSCRFSVAAAPFHKKILETARAVGLPVYVAVHQSSDEAQYREAGEFGGARFILGRALPVEPAGTPTILLIRNNLVERAWNGFQQTEAQRKELLDSIVAVKTVLE